MALHIIKKDACDHNLHQKSILPYWKRANENEVGDSNAQLNQLEINRQELYFLDYFNPLMLEVKIYVEQDGFEFKYITNLSI